MADCGFFHFSGGGLVVAGALLAGCGHAPAPGPARAEGWGTFEFVRPPAAPDAGDLQMEVKERLTKDEFVPPRSLGELAEPVYPATAMAGRAGAGDDGGASGGRCRRAGDGGVAERAGVVDADGVGEGISRGGRGGGGAVAVSAGGGAPFYNGDERAGDLAEHDRQ